MPEYTWTYRNRLNAGVDFTRQIVCSTKLNSSGKKFVPSHYCRPIWRFKVCRCVTDMRPPRDQLQMGDDPSICQLLPHSLRLLPGDELVSSAMYQEGWCSVEATFYLRKRTAANNVLCGWLGKSCLMTRNGIVSVFCNFGLQT
jgi:hypothetical protein